MNVSDVAGALYTPDDGVLYPPALAWALAGLVRSKGGAIWEGVGAERIAISSGKARGVELANGDVLESDRVIVASGVWTRRILQASNLDIALKHSITHNTVVTVGRKDRWTEARSLLDGVQGVIAIHETPGRSWPPTRPASTSRPPDAADRTSYDMMTVELRGGRHEAFAAEKHMQQTQVLAQLRHRYEGYDIRGISGHWAGLLDGAPDNHPLVGPHPDVDGLWVGCGLTGYGVQRGPGVGEALAAFALGKDPAVDVSLYRLGRFDASRDFKIDLSADNPFEGFENIAVSAMSASPLRHLQISPSICPQRTTCSAMIYLVYCAIAANSDEPSATTKPCSQRVEADVRSGLGTINRAKGV